MKLICSQPELVRGMTAVGHALSSRSTLPILAHVLLKAQGGSLTLSATDLSLAITYRLPAEIAFEGGVTIPAKLFSELVGSFPKEAPVELTTDEQHVLTLTGPRCRATIRGTAPNEFPAVSGALGNEPSLLFDAATLKEIIAQVAIAAAEDDSRPVFLGVHVQVKDEKLTFAAADSFRLAVRTTAIPEDAREFPPALIPAKSLQILSRVLAPGEEVAMLALETAERAVLFHTERLDLVSRQIEGAFPNFWSIIPQGHTTRVVVATKEFAAAVKSVLPFARDNAQITHVTVEGGEHDGDEAGRGGDEGQGSAAVGQNGTITLEASAEEVGGNRCTVPARVEGPRQQIIFNARYLADALGVIGTPEVAVELISPTRPGTLTPVGSNGEYLYIVMPMQGKGG